MPEARIQFSLGGEKRVDCLWLPEGISDLDATILVEQHVARFLEWEWDWVDD